MGLGACSKVVEMSRMGSEGRESGMSVVHTASFSNDQREAFSRSRLVLGQIDNLPKPGIGNLRCVAVIVPLHRTLVYNGIVDTHIRGSVADIE